MGNSREGQPPARIRPTPQQKAWITRLRPALPQFFPEATGALDLRPSGPPDLRSYSRLFPFTILLDGLPHAEIIVKVPRGRKAGDVNRTFRAYKLLANAFASEPHLHAPEALGVWEDPPALIMRRAPGEPLYMRLKECRNWSIETGCQLAQHFVTQAGRWLGRLHSLEPPPWADPAPDPLEQMPHLLARLRPHGIDPYEEKRIREQIQTLSHRSLDNPTPLHGDFTLRNVLCHLPQHVTLLDTELAHQGDPAQDIGWFLAALHMIDKWQILGGDMVYTRAVIRQTSALFLQGYASIRPLPPANAIRAYASLRLLERWGDFVEREQSRNIAGFRILIIRRINQHFIRSLAEIARESLSGRGFDESSKMP